MRHTSHSQTWRIVLPDFQGVNNAARFYSGLTCQSKSTVTCTTASPALLKRSIHSESRGHRQGLHDRRCGVLLIRRTDSCFSAGLLIRAGLSDR
jgi:hypothetical protein